MKFVEKYMEGDDKWKPKEVEAFMASSLEGYQDEMGEIYMWDLVYMSEENSLGLA